MIVGDVTCCLDRFVGMKDLFLQLLIISPATDVLPADND